MPIRRRRINKRTHQSAQRAHAALRLQERIGVQLNRTERRKITMRAGSGHYVVVYRKGDISLCRVPFGDVNGYAIVDRRTGEIATWYSAEMARDFFGLSKAVCP